MIKRFILAAAALGAAALLALPLAQTAQAAPREAAPTAFDPVAHKRVVEVSEQLRCLVCQNQSIAESNAELAVDLRNQVIEPIRKLLTTWSTAMGTLCFTSRRSNFPRQFCGLDRSVCS